MLIRSVKSEDIEQITAIYNHYVKHTIITFEEEEVGAREMEHRMETIIARYPFFVIENEGTIAGYAYGSTFRKKSAYRFTVETTVYLAASYTGKGYGTSVYQHLLSQLKDQGYANALGVIALPNPPSVRLHEKLGFMQVGHLKRVGKKFGKWIDTGYWQYILNEE